mgnify:CR=1 FL=1
MTETKIILVKNESIGRICIDMGLNKWFQISRNTENQNTRTNAKKIGCLFEAFIGALFLDFNGMEIHDDHGWWDRLDFNGPGFQMAQRFIESVFDQHVNWSIVLNEKFNHKNTLQLLIQDRFKTVPTYIELEIRSIAPGACAIDNDDDTSHHHPIVNSDNLYVMGVYLALKGAPRDIHGEVYSHGSRIYDATTNITAPFSLEAIDQYYQANPHHCIFYLGKGSHRNKQKAEQYACQQILKMLNNK